MIRWVRISFSAFKTKKKGKRKRETKEQTKKETRANGVGFIASSFLSLRLVRADGVVRAEEKIQKNGEHSNEMTH